MAFDINRKYFLVRIDDAAKELSNEEFENLQGMINKVEILKPRVDGYLVISKADTPKLFNSALSLIKPFYETILEKKE